MASPAHLGLTLLSRYSLLNQAFQLHPHRHKDVCCFCHRVLSVFPVKEYYNFPLGNSHAPTFCGTNSSSRMGSHWFKHRKGEADVATRPQMGPEFRIKLKEGNTYKVLTLKGQKRRLCAIVKALDINKARIQHYLPPR